MDISNLEELAEKLHEWYLEATAKLNPESYNPNAQKDYKDLNEEQRFIDKYIAEKVRKQLLQEVVEIIENENEECCCGGVGEDYGRCFRLDLQEKLREIIK